MRRDQSDEESASDENDGKQSDGDDVSAAGTGRSIG